MTTFLSGEDLATGSWRLIDPIALTHGKTLESMSEEEHLGIVFRHVDRIQNEGTPIEGDVKLGPVPQTIPSALEHLGPVTMIGLFERINPS